MRPSARAYTHAKGDIGRWLEQKCTTDRLRAGDNLVALDSCWRIPADEGAEQQPPCKGKAQLIECMLCLPIVLVIHLETEDALKWSCPVSMVPIRVKDARGKVLDADPFTYDLRSRIFQSRGVGHHFTSRFVSTGEVGPPGVYAYDDTIQHGLATKLGQYQVAAAMGGSDKGLKPPIQKDMYTVFAVYQLRGGHGAQDQILQHQRRALSDTLSLHAEFLQPGDIPQLAYVNSAYKELSLGECAWIKGGQSSANATKRRQYQLVDTSTPSPSETPRTMAGSMVATPVQSPTAPAAASPATSTQRDQASPMSTSSKASQLWICCICGSVGLSEDLPVDDIQPVDYCHLCKEFYVHVACQGGYPKADYLCGYCCGFGLLYVPLFAVGA